MRAPRRSLVALVWLAGGAGVMEPATGEEPIKDERPAETIRVEGEGATAADLTGAVTIIHADQFESRITSFAELLRQAVGLQVRSYGGLGAFATVSIRGSTSEQVNIYLDGVLLNPALGGGVNLADFSLAHIDSIEIYRGFTPSSLGGGAIGGAINIRTKKPMAGRPAASGSLSFGTYRTGGAAGLFSWSREAGGERPADGLVSIDIRRSDGDFRFYDRNGTDVLASDDGYETRRNNRFWMGDLLARTGLALKGGGRINLESTLARRVQGVPGIDALQSLHARSETTRAMIKAGLADQPFHDGRLRLSLEAAYSRTWQEFEDRFGDIGVLTSDTRNVMDAAAPAAILRWHPAGAGGIDHFVTLLAAARRETATRTDRLSPSPDPGRATRMAWTLNAEDEIHLAGGRVIVSPSARWESFTDRFTSEPGATLLPADSYRDSSLLGRLGAVWRPRPHLSARASAGRFYRVPSFTELFGDQGTVKGNLELLPESGRNYDVGGSWETARHGLLDSFHLEASLFRRDADNLIQFVQTSQDRVTAQNTGRARVTGAELSMRLGLFGRLSGDVNYTWQVSEDRSDTFRLGSDLPGRPRHEASALVSMPAERGRPFYEFSYVGPNFFDPAAAAIGGSSVSRDLIRVPGRYFHNLGYTRHLRSGLEFTIEVDNIFNVRTVDVVRYPLPGRLVEAKLRMKVP